MSFNLTAATLTCLLLTCKDRCGSAGGSSVCSCDESCVMMGTCCLDYYALCKTQTYTTPMSISVSQNYAQFASCTLFRVPYFYRRNKTYYYWSVAKCPRQTSAEEIEACENPLPIHDDSTMADLLSFIPISYSGILFRNVYCLRCHFSNINYGKSRQVGLEFDPPSSERSQWISDDQRSVFQSLKKHVLKLIFTDSETPCFTKGTADQVMRCPSHVHGKDHPCYKYTEPIKVNDSDSVFRNVHCALCNGFNTSNVQCHKSSQNGVTDMGSNPRLSVLFDLSRPGIAEVDLLDPKTKRKLQSIPTCEAKNTLYNTISKRCIDSDEFHAEFLPYNATRVLFANVKVLYKCTKRLTTSVVNVIEKVIARFKLDTSWKISLLPNEIGSNRFYYSVEFTDLNTVTYESLENVGNHILTSLGVGVSHITFCWPIEKYEFRIRNFKISDLENCNDKNLREYGDEAFDLTVQNGVEYISLFGSDNSTLRKWTPVRSELGIFYRNYRDENQTRKYIALCERDVCRRRQVYNREHLNETKDGIFLVETLGGLKLELNEDQIQISGNSVVVCMDEFYRQNYDLATEIETKLTIITCSLSLFGLTVVLVTYSLFRTLRTIPGKTLMNMCASLFIVMLLFNAVIFQPSLLSRPLLCSIVGMFVHYLWLVVFFWTNVISYDTLRTFRGPVTIRDESQKYRCYRRYCAYAYLLPAVLLAICGSLTFWVENSGFKYTDKQVCWISNPDQLVYTFLLPIAVICVFNLLFFGFTMRAIRDAKKMAKVLKSKRKKTNSSYVIIMKLSLIMGLTWYLGFLASYGNTPVLKIAYTFFNGSQGFLIFVFFVLRPRVFRLYHRRLAGLPEESSSATYSSSQDTTSNQ
ncbi:uncharacterized protein LOC141907707 [Tubulanus polymorphus]|uniref:uncharacterized protein LOC141907707 n=1 Tax=Tubulanus polymorphus TaxID=672921 RepID=UPI003DA23B35